MHCVPSQPTSMMLPSALTNACTHPWHISPLNLTAFFSPALGAPHASPCVCACKLALLPESIHSYPTLPSSPSLSPPLPSSPPPPPAALSDARLLPGRPHLRTSRFASNLRQLHRIPRSVRYALRLSGFNILDLLGNYMGGWHSPRVQPLVHLKLRYLLSGCVACLREASSDPRAREVRSVLSNEQEESNAMPHGPARIAGIEAEKGTAMPDVWRSSHSCALVTLHVRCFGRKLMCLLSCPARSFSVSRHNERAPVDIPRQLQSGFSLCPRVCVRNGSAGNACRCLMQNHGLSLTMLGCSVNACPGTLCGQCLVRSMLVGEDLALLFTKLFLIASA